MRVLANLSRVSCTVTGAGDFWWNFWYWLWLWCGCMKDYLFSCAALLQHDQWRKRRWSLLQHLACEQQFCSVTTPKVCNEKKLCGKFLWNGIRWTRLFLHSQIFDSEVSWLSLPSWEKWISETVPQTPSYKLKSSWKMSHFLQEKSLFNMTFYLMFLKSFFLSWFNTFSKGSDFEIHQQSTPMTFS